MTSVRIRAAASGDAPALGSLGALLVALHHDFDPQRFIAPTPSTHEGYGRFLRSEMGRPEAIVLVAEKDGDIAGYAYGVLAGSDYMALRGPAGILHDLVVDPSHRRDGIGRTLLEAAVAALRERGAPRVVISTAHRNEAAQALFASAGFRRTMIEMTREGDQA